MAILTMKYSVYPWDLMVLKKGNQLIFDKADENKDKVGYYMINCLVNIFGNANNK